MSQQNFKYSTNSLISCCLYRMRSESFDISRRPHLEIPKPWNLEVLNAVKEAKKDSTLYFRFPNFFGLIFQKIWPIVWIFILLPMSCFLMGSLKSSSISLKRNELLYLLYSPRELCPHTYGTSCSIMTRLPVLLYRLGDIWAQDFL